MNIRPLAFVDCSVMTAGLILRHKTRFGDDKTRQKTAGSAHHDTESIFLRGPKDPSSENWFSDEAQIDYPLLKDWKAARNLLARIKHAAAPFLDSKPAVLGKVMIVALKPFGFVDWHIDEGEYAEAHHRLHLCLVPSPGAVLYSGGEQRVPTVGELCYFNNRVLHSAANFAPYQRIQLIVDVRKP